MTDNPLPVPFSVTAIPLLKEKLTGLVTPTSLVCDSLVPTGETVVNVTKDSKETHYHYQARMSFQGDGATTTEVTPVSLVKGVDGKFTLYKSTPQVTEYSDVDGNTSVKVQKPSGRLSTVGDLVKIDGNDLSAQIEDKTKRDSAALPVKVEPPAHIKAYLETHAEVQIR